MAYNPSLAKFKNEMRDVKNSVRNGVHASMMRIAEEAAENMRSAAPKDEGALAASVRVQDVSKVGAASVTLSVLIRAGGQATFRRNKKSGEIYDYAVANEFGTREMQAQPFFYNTFRRYKSEWPGQAAESLQEAIKGNKEILALRKESNRSANRHGDVVIKPR